MMQMSKEKFIPYVINKNGKQVQVIKAIEEMSELQKELAKDLNYPDPKNKNKILEELADVLLMCEELKELYRFSSAEITAVQQEKIDRFNRLPSVKAKERTKKVKSLNKTVLSNIIKTK